MTGECCNRAPSSKETSLREAGYDTIECAILEVSRLFFQTFAVPHSQSWLMALQRAELRFPSEAGAQIGLDILAAVQAMRMSRVSSFCFNNPTCPGCSQIVSEHERQFMGIFRALRHRRMSEAQTHALLICEGNDTRHLLNRMMALVSSTCEAEAAGDPGGAFRDFVGIEVG
ncbi:MAG: hypothetical protein AAGA87_05165 [Pseudomonadota bacterium]